MSRSRLSVVRNFVAGPSFFSIVSAPGLLYRKRTARRRALPSLFLIGAAKCGTTSLASYVARHPSYVAAHNNELMFLQQLPNFTSKYETNSLLRRMWGHYEQGRDSYRKFFPLRRALAAAERRTGIPAMTGDHTPLYLYCPVATERVRSICPDAKLIVLLRDPVSRAFSDYNMFYDRTTLEDRTFEQAVDDELSGACTTFQLNYLYQGVYEPHIRRWMKAFSKEQLLIMDSLEMFRNPAAVVRRTFEWLGWPAHDAARFPVRNKGRYRAPMQEETRRRLQDYYRPHNERLYDLLKIDFGWDAPHGSPYGRPTRPARVNLRPRAASLSAQVKNTP